MSCRTYDELEQEAAYREEQSPPALARLMSKLRVRYPRAEIGSKGDRCHLYGGHRSRRWIKTSRWCTNREFTVSRTVGDREGGNENWYVAVDINPDPSDLHVLYAMCQRLDKAIRAGQLEKIIEWYGTFGDDDHVDGWDNIANRIASADSSHLKHLHMRWDRGRANEDHDDVFKVLTGAEGEEWMYTHFGDGESTVGGSPYVQEMQLDLEEGGADLSAAGGADGKFGPGTAAALAAKLDEAVTLIPGLSDRVGADVAGDGHTYEAKQRHALQALLRWRAAGSGVSLPAGTVLSLSVPQTVIKLGDVTVPAEVLRATVAPAG